jgi:hypothetical protein
MRTMAQRQPKRFEMPDDNCDDTTAPPMGAQQKVGKMVTISDRGKNINNNKDIEIKGDKTIIKINNIIDNNKDNNNKSNNINMPKMVNKRKISKVIKGNSGIVRVKHMSEIPIEVEHTGRSGAQILVNSIMVAKTATHSGKDETPPQ